MRFKLWYLPSNPFHLHKYKTPQCYIHHRWSFFSSIMLPQGQGSHCHHGSCWLCPQPASSKRSATSKFSVDFEIGWFWSFLFLLYFYPAIWDFLKIFAEGFLPCFMKRFELWDQVFLLLFVSDFSFCLSLWNRLFETNLFQFLKLHDKIEMKNPGYFDQNINPKS